MRAKGKDERSASIGTSVDSIRPILVTLQRGPVAEGLAANVELADRIDVFEIEQFVALNVRFPYSTWWIHTRYPIRPPD